MNTLGVLGIALLALIVGISIGIRITARRYAALTYHAVHYVDVTPDEHEDA